MQLDASAGMAQIPAEAFVRYVPRVLAEWEFDAGTSHHQEIDGSLVLVDISGFTPLSERLARRGRIGAEQLTDVLNAVFGDMLRTVYNRGGALVKFGGDALLLLFRDKDHARQAADAAVEMRGALRSSTATRQHLGSADLRLTAGVYSGPVHLFRPGSIHHELIVAGPGADSVARLEKQASPGQIMVSQQTALALPASATRPSDGDGLLLRWRSARGAETGWTARRRVDDAMVRKCIPIALREHLEHGPPDPDHRQAVAAFVSFTGLSQLLEREGPGALADHLQRIVGSVQEHAREEGATFLATDVDRDGGKIILATGVPAAGEDPDGQMLRTVRSIIDDVGSLGVRAGVARGHVFAGDVGLSYRRTYTVIGRTVNIAARLAAAAPTGSLLTTAAVLSRARPLFQTKRLEPMALKGLEAPITPFRVGGERGVRPEAAGDVRFVGRRSELDAICAAAPGPGSTGAVFGVVGERGIGKTRLLAEVAGRTQLTVFDIISEPYGQDAPYRAIRDSLRALLGVERAQPDRMAAEIREAIAAVRPDLAGLAPLIAAAAHVPMDETPDSAVIAPRFRVARTADVIIALLEKLRPGPLLLRVEDVHWLDDATDQLVQRLAAAASDHPWLVVGTGRRPPQFSHHLIELAPLSDADAAAMVESATEHAPLRPHDIQELVTRAAGNPLFLEEMLRAVTVDPDAAGLPEAIDAIVTIQIDALDHGSRRILRTASVLGRSFPVAGLAALLQRDGGDALRMVPDALTPFLRDDGRGRLWFRNALVRDVAYAGLPFARRRRLHSYAAEVVEEYSAGATEEASPTLALHYAAAGDDVNAWRYSVMAGHHARAAHANDDAAQHYRRGLEAARRLAAVDDAARAEVWWALGVVYEQAGRFEDSLAALRRASRLFRADGVAVARIHVDRALARMRIGAYPAALADISRGLGLIADAAGDEAESVRCQLLSIRASVRQAQWNSALALEVGSEVVGLAKRGRDDKALARAHSVLHWASIMQGLPDAGDHARVAMEIYDELADLDGTAHTTNAVGAEAYFDGRWDDAIEAYEASRSAFERAGNETGAAVASSNIGEVMVNQRRFEDARQLLVSAVRTLQAAGSANDTLFAEIQLARALRGLGEQAAAISALEAVRGRARREGQVFAAVEAALHLAHALVDAGQLGRAGALLREAEDGAGADDVVVTTTIARLQAELDISRGRAAVARRRLDRALELATAHGLLHEQFECRELAARMHDAGERHVLSDPEISRLAGRLGIQV